MVNTVAEQLICLEYTVAPVRRLFRNFKTTQTVVISIRSSIQMLQFNA